MLVLLLATSLLFVGLTVLLVTVGTMARERSQVSASLAAIESISGPMPTAMREAYDQPFHERVTEPTLNWLTKTARKVVGADWPAKTRRRLDMAGAPEGWDADRMLAVKAMAALLLGVLMAYLMGKGITMLAWGGAGLVLGFLIPDLLLTRQVDARTEAIRRSLADSIDLLTVAVESGLAFDAAIAQVAQNTDGPLAGEFSRVLHEIQIGSSRADALHALADRTEVEELRVFLNSMVQAEKLGIPIAEVLRVQTAEMRTKRTQMIEEKAAKLPVKIVFPVMLGIMPSIFIVILGPAMINIMDMFAVATG